MHVETWKYVRKELESRDVPKEFMNRDEWDTHWGWTNRRGCRIVHGERGCNVVFPGWIKTTPLGNSHHQPGLPSYKGDLKTFFHVSQTMR